MINSDARGWDAGPNGSTTNTSLRPLVLENLHFPSADWPEKLEALAGQKKLNKKDQTILELRHDLIRGALARAYCLENNLPKEIKTCPLIQVIQAYSRATVLLIDSIHCVKAVSCQDGNFKVGVVASQQEDPAEVMKPKQVQELIKRYQDQVYTPEMRLHWKGLDAASAVQGGMDRWRIGYLKRDRDAQREKYLKALVKERMGPVRWDSSFQTRRREEPEMDIPDMPPLYRTGNMAWTERDREPVLAEAELSDTLDPEIVQFEFTPNVVDAPKEVIFYRRADLDWLVVSQSGNADNNRQSVSLAKAGDVVLEQVSDVNLARLFLFVDQDELLQSTEEAEAKDWLERAENQLRVLNPLMKRSEPISLPADSRAPEKIVEALAQVGFELNLRFHSIVKQALQENPETVRSAVLDYIKDYVAETESWALFKRTMAWRQTRKMKRASVKDLGKTVWAKVATMDSRDLAHDRMIRARFAAQVISNQLED